MNKFIFLCLLALFSTNTVLAQSAEQWDWKVAPYLWTVGIDGSLSAGPVNQDIDVSFSDLFSDMDFAFEVYAEVGKGNHTVHFDYSYMRLKPDPTDLPSPQFPAGSTLSTKMTINIFEPAYNYRFDGPGLAALVVGARYMDIEMRMTPEINLPSLPVELPISQDPIEVGPSWWDAFVGIKTENQISENWDFGFYGTIGAGESDLPWTLQAMFGRRFSNNNRLGLGLRVWGIDYSENKGSPSDYARIDATFYGLMVGYEFN